MHVLADGDMASLSDPFTASPRTAPCCSALLFMFEQAQVLGLPIFIASDHRDDNCNYDRLCLC